MKRTKILPYLIFLLVLVFSTKQANAAGDFGAWDLTKDHNGMNCGQVSFTEKDLTLEFWIYLDEQDGKNIDGTSVISNRHDGSYGFTASLNKNSNNNNKIDLRLWFKTVNNAAYACWIPREELSGKWNHIAFVISSKDKKATAYLNTELYSVVENFDGDWLGNIKANGTNVGDLMLAAWYQSPKFHGKMADVRVWNTVRTEQNIKDNYKKVMPEKQPGLQKYYTFDDEVFAQRPVKLAIANNQLTWEAEGESWDIEVRTSHVDGTVLKSETVTQKSYSLAGLEPTNVVFVKTMNNGFYSGWAFKYDFIKIGCVGDSNTYGAETSTPSQYAWPIQIRSMIGDDYETRNFGVNGAGMMEHLNDAWKNKTAYADNKAYDPDIIIIALGTNDSKDNYWNAEKFKDSYVNLIKEFQGYSAEPQIYMAIPIKAYGNTWQINDQTIREKLAPIMQEIAKEMALPLIDLYDATKDIADLMASDKIHPKDAGHKIIARRIADIMLMDKPVIKTGTTSTATAAAYYWYKDNTLLDGATEVNYTASEAGNYKVAVKLTNEANDVIVSEPIVVTQANTMLSAIYNNGLSTPTIEGENISVTAYSDYIEIVNATDAILSLYNIGGYEVTRVSLNDDTQLVDTSSLAKGIYICKVQKGNEVVTTKILK